MKIEIDPVEFCGKMIFSRLDVGYLENLTGFPSVKIWRLAEDFLKRQYPGLPRRAAAACANSNLYSQKQIRDAMWSGRFGRWDGPADFSSGQWEPPKWKLRNFGPQSFVDIAKWAYPEKFSLEK